MGASVRAVGFDIDGTLYPQMQMYRCSLPILIRHPILMSRYARARRTLRREDSAGAPSSESFHRRQAAAILQFTGAAGNTDMIDRMVETVQREIYGRWEELFRVITPFPGMIELVTELKLRGVPMGLLSDFPLGIKPEVLGIADLFDIRICSEDLGYLKPSPVPFRMLAESLGCKPEEILYVGNSYGKDAVGAAEFGMKTALLVGSLRVARRLVRKSGDGPRPDILFTSYEMLSKRLTSFLQ